MGARSLSFRCMFEHPLSSLSLQVRRRMVMATSSFLQNLTDLIPKGLDAIDKKVKDNAQKGVKQAFVELCQNLAIELSYCKARSGDTSKVSVLDAPAVLKLWLRGRKVSSGQSRSVSLGKQF
jgi:hypothetical protein